MTLDFVAHVRRESVRFGAVLADTDPGAAVPTCPEWAAADLLWHLTEVQLFWGAIVRDRLDDPAPAEAGKPPRPADYAALLELFGTATAGLATALEQAPETTSVWTWYDPDQSVGFVRRRQAHEALIHRLDAELTAGVPAGDVDPALATDGVLEALDWMFGGFPEWAAHELDGPIGRVATTDTGAEHLVQVGRWSGRSPNTGKEYTDAGWLALIESGEPSFSVSGTARDLDAWLWNRPTSAEVTIDGDAERFTAIIADGVQ
jgi:uncharacterized protein (TIGR03083 family)